MQTNEIFSYFNKILLNFTNPSNLQVQEEYVKNYESYYISVYDPQLYAEKITNVQNVYPLFNDETIFVGLNPFVNTGDFNRTLLALIAYVDLLRDQNSVFLNDTFLARRLYNFAILIYNRLPKKLVDFQFPWGTNWYEFSILMPQYFMHTNIMLKPMGYNLDNYVIKLGQIYLPTPIKSMGWTRAGGNVVRMFLPFIYYKLLSGHFINQISAMTDVQTAYNIVSLNSVMYGDGINKDLSYIDHENVRAWGYLLTGIYTYVHYEYFFVNISYNLVKECLNKVLYFNGQVHPALISRGGWQISREGIYYLNTQNYYRNGIFSCDLNKVLTIKCPKYFCTVLGQRTNLAYYEADRNNDTMAPIWLFAKRPYIGNRSVAFGQVIVENEPGVWSPLPRHVSTTTTTESFVPTRAKCISIALEDELFYAGILFTDVTIANVCDYKSLTILTPDGYYQYYYDVNMYTNSEIFKCNLMEGAANEYDNNEHLFYNRALLVRIFNTNGSLTRLPLNNGILLQSIYNTNKNLYLEYAIEVQLYENRLHYVRTNNIIEFNFIKMIIISDKNNDYTIYAYNTANYKLIISTTQDDTNMQNNFVTKLFIDIDVIRSLDSNIRTVIPENSFYDGLGYVKNEKGSRSYLFYVILYQN